MEIKKFLKNENTLSNKNIYLGVFQDKQLLLENEDVLQKKD